MGTVGRLRYDTAVVGERLAELLLGAAREDPALP